MFYHIALLSNINLNCTLQSQTSSSNCDGLSSTEPYLINISGSSRSVTSTSAVFYVYPAETYTISVKSKNTAGLLSSESKLTSKAPSAGKNLDSAAELLSLSLYLKTSILTTCDSLCSMHFKTMFTVTIQIILTDGWQQKMCLFVLAPQFAPTSFTVTGSTPHCVKVMWSAAFYPNGGIKGYQVLFL